MTRTLQVAVKTDRGRRRRENEDSVLFREYSLPDAASGAYLMAVADGMGGAAGGQVASSEALKALEESVAQWAANPASGLSQAVIGANRRVRDVAQERPELMGMATTLVAAFVVNGRAWLVNVGDSRCYLVRDGRCQRLTEDHSWVAEQVRAGVMTDEEASQHPRRNIITRSVGSDESVQPDVFPEIALQDGDCLLLCSDGLHGLVSDAEIAAVCSSRSPSQAAEELVSLANARGGPDNISVIIGQAGGGDGNTMVFHIGRGGHDFAVGKAAIAGVGAAVVLVLVAALVVFTGGKGNDENASANAEATGTAVAALSASATLEVSPSPTEALEASAVPSVTPVIGLGACPDIAALADQDVCLIGRFIKGIWTDQAEGVRSVGLEAGIVDEEFDPDVVLKVVWFYNPSLHDSDEAAACNVKQGEAYILPIKDKSWPQIEPPGFSENEYLEWGAQPCSTPTPLSGNSNAGSSDGEADDNENP